MNLNELKKLAEAATPGPWCEGMSSHQTISKHPKFLNYRIAEFHHARDAEWCDAANPQTILALIELIEKQHEALKLAYSWVNEGIGLLPVDTALAAYDAFEKGEQ